jgi:hypothetical protein
MPVAQRRSAQGRWRAPRCWRAAWFGSAIGSKTADAQRRTLVATGAGRAFPRRTPNREFVRCAANWSSQVLSRGRTARKGRPSSVLSRGNSGGGHAIKRTQFVAIGIAKISEINLTGGPWRTPGGSSIVVPHSRRRLCAMRRPASDRVSCAVAGRLMARTDQRNAPAGPAKRQSRRCAEYTGRGAARCPARHS